MKRNHNLAVSICAVVCLAATIITALLVVLRESPALAVMFFSLAALCGKWALDYWDEKRRAATAHFVAAYPNPTWVDPAKEVQAAMRRFVESPFEPPRKP